MVIFPIATWYLPCLITGVFSALRLNAAKAAPVWTFPVVFSRDLGEIQMVKSTNDCRLFLLCNINRGFLSHGGTPIAGLFIRENPMWKWMITRGTPNGWRFGMSFHDGFRLPAFARCWLISDKFTWVCFFQLGIPKSHDWSENVGMVQKMWVASIPTA